MPSREGTLGKSTMTGVAISLVRIGVCLGRLVMGRKTVLLDWWLVVHHILEMIFHPQRLEDENWQNWPRVEKKPGEHDVQLLQQGIQVSAPVTAWFMATVNYTCWLTHLDCWWFCFLYDIDSIWFYKWCVCVYIYRYTLQIHHDIMYLYSKYILIDTYRIL